jgi:hypothetical protein
MPRTSTPETEQESRHVCAARHRSVAFLQLITTAALALCTAVAATAVSIGMARAGVSPMRGSGQTPAFAVALGFVFLLWAVPMVRAIMAAAQRTN